MEDGGSAAWTTYFHTRDADAVRARVEEAGGAVRVAPMDVFTAGRLAQFTDPTGADFAVWEPKDTGGLEVLMEPETLCWTELYTTDAAAAKRFYTAVFSWTYEDMSMGDDLVYSVVSAPGGGTEGDTGQGGIMQLPQENLSAGSTSEWHPYFATEDCDATCARGDRCRCEGADPADGRTRRGPPRDAQGPGRCAVRPDQGRSGHEVTLRASRGGVAAEDVPGCRRRAEEVGTGPPPPGGGKNGSGSRQTSEPPPPAGAGAGPGSGPGSGAPDGGGSGECPPSAAGASASAGAFSSVGQHLLAEPEEVGGHEADEIAGGQPERVDQGDAAQTVVALEEGEEGPAGGADRGGADRGAQLVEEAHHPAAEGPAHARRDEGAAQRQGDPVDQRFPHAQEPGGEGGADGAADRGVAVQPQVDGDRGADLPGARAIARMGSSTV